MCTIPTVPGATAVTPSSGTVVAAYSLVTVTCQPGALSGGADIFYFSCHNPSFTAFQNPTCLGNLTFNVLNHLCTLSFSKKHFKNITKVINYLIQLFYHSTTSLNLGTYTKTVVCEGRTASLACPTGQMIRVHKVTWGASTAGVCSKAPTSEQVCAETQTAQTKIHSLCSDKTSCEIEANVKDLGDPCELGVQKQLYVEHQCLTYPRAGNIFNVI